MTKEEAKRFISRYRPCEHENADTRLGNGKIWARCEDCGATFQQENWQNARDAAAEFDIALEVLTKPVERSSKGDADFLRRLRKMTYAEIHALLTDAVPQLHST